MKLAAAKVPVSTVWTSSDAPRDLDAAAVAAVPDVAAWAKSMTTETRLGLHGRTLTQLLFAEPVLVRSEKGGWSEIVAPWQPSSEDALGYPGWVPSAHLGELPSAATSPVAVKVPTAALTAEPGSGALTELSFGTVLASTDHADGFTQVALPDGASGWLADDVIRSVEEPSTPEDRIRLGSLFLGLEYLWGGTSAYGLDCSGLTHAVSRVLGQRIPRDAHDQADRLEPVPLDEVRPGDLYFFARPGQQIHHVGFVSAEGMLHASETGKVLENEALLPERRETLVAAARL
ncbi:cell wall-associated NlpC family hydrolase [Kribbella amoyensis]|uniref:Cell wall-associated NlpC family hydrolase n=1 Tax=Kribbella amoyensis TaxID=996641 RepID=A0A561BY07_9ACTN|nr:C40 family peptidase [Kribbella amoyensis]TWD83733.1 cell wall-associated NlpC family hydrolase [Kribbella amoyensis]